MADKFEMNNIPKEKFKFASGEGRLHDKKLETKPIGYFKDAWLRFKKNKASIVAACIILFIVLFVDYVTLSVYMIVLSENNEYCICSCLVFTP